MDDGANDNDAAAGAMAAAGGSRRTGRRCRSNVPCAMYQGMTTDDAIHVIAWVTRTLNEMNSTKNMKEQYDCYVIDV